MCTFRSAAAAIRSRKLPLILPHEMIPHVRAHHRGIIDHGLHMEQTRAYWTHMRAHSQWARNHPGSDRHHPAFIYGDDARHTQNEKLCVVYCGFVCDTRTNSMLVHQPLFVIRCSLSVGFETLQAYLKPVPATAEQPCFASCFCFGNVSRAGIGRVMRYPPPPRGCGFLELPVLRLPPTVPDHRSRGQMRILRPS